MNMTQQTDIEKEVPYGHEKMGSVVTNGLIFIGGGKAGSSDSNRFYSFSPSQGSYKTLKSIPFSINGCELVKIPKENKLMFPNMYPYEKFGIYNIDSDTWDTNERPYGFQIGERYQACFDLSDTLHVVGGTKGIKNHYSMDINSKTWIKLKEIPKYTKQGGLVCGPTGNLYLFGGTDHSYVFDDMWIYDNGTDLWAKGAKLPKKLCSFGYDANSRCIVIVGGSTSQYDNNPPFLNEIYVYSFGSSTWMTLDSTLPNGIRDLTAVIYGRDIHCFAGSRTDKRYTTDHVVMAATSLMTSAQNDDDEDKKYQRKSLLSSIKATELVTWSDPIIKDLDTGIYEIDITMLESGIYYLRILLNYVEIVGSPYRIYVHGLNNDINIYYDALNNKFDNKSLKNQNIEVKPIYDLDQNKFIKNSNKSSTQVMLLSDVQKAIDYSKYILRESWRNADSIVLTDGRRELHFAPTLKSLAFDAKDKGFPTNDTKTIYINLKLAESFGVEVNAKGDRIQGNKYTVLKDKFNRQGIEIVKVKLIPKKYRKEYPLKLKDKPIDEEKFQEFVKEKEIKDAEEAKKKAAEEEKKRIEDAKFKDKDFWKDKWPTKELSGLWKTNKGSMYLEEKTCEGYYEASNQTLIGTYTIYDLTWNGEKKVRGWYGRTNSSDYGKFEWKFNDAFNECKEGDAFYTPTGTKKEHFTLNKFKEYIQLRYIKKPKIEIVYYRGEKISKEEWWVKHKKKMAEEEKKRIEDERKKKEEYDAKTDEQKEIERKEEEALKRKELETAYLESINEYDPSGTRMYRTRCKCGQLMKKKPWDAVKAKKGGYAYCDGINSSGTRCGKTINTGHILECPLFKRTFVHNENGYHYCQSCIATGKDSIHLWPEIWLSDDLELLYGLDRDTAMLNIKYDDTIKGYYCKFSKNTAQRLEINVKDNIIITINKKEVALIVSGFYDDDLKLEPNKVIDNDGNTVRTEYCKIGPYVTRHVKLNINDDFPINVKLVEQRFEELYNPTSITFTDNEYDLLMLDDEYRKEWIYEYLYIRPIFQKIDINDNNVILSPNIVIDIYPISNPKNNNFNLLESNHNEIERIAEERDLSDELLKNIKLMPKRIVKYPELPDILKIYGKRHLTKKPGIVYVLGEQSYGQFGWVTHNYISF